MHHRLTTNAGAAIPDNQNSITAGPRELALLQDYQLIQKVAAQNRERIPERAVRAKGMSISARPRQIAVDHALKYVARRNPASPEPRPSMTFAPPSTSSWPIPESIPPWSSKDLIEACKDCLNRSSGSRFFGWVIGGTLPAALAADLLTVPSAPSACWASVPPISTTLLPTTQASYCPKLSNQFCNRQLTCRPSSSFRQGMSTEGLYDDFAALIPIAHRHNAWVNIDGAFGLWAAASPSYAHLLNCSHLADSWATDGHKWLNVPYDSAYAFIAHPESHRAAMSKGAAYIVADTDAPDRIHFNPEMSRHARGFAPYAALRELGRNGVASLVDRCWHFATQLTARNGALPNAKPLNTTIINQGLVRFLNPTPTATVTDHDTFTDQIITAICAEGTAFFIGTTFQGQRAMRISICNWPTNDEDIDTIVSAVERVVATTANQVAVAHSS